MPLWWTLYSKPAAASAKLAIIFVLILVPPCLCAGLLAGSFFLGKKSPLGGVTLLTIYLILHWFWSVLESLQALKKDFNSYWEWLTLVSHFIPLVPGAQYASTYTDGVLVGDQLPSPYTQD